MTPPLAFYVLTGAVAVPLVVVYALLWVADEASLSRYRSDGRRGPEQARPEPEPARPAWAPPPIAVVVVTVMVVLRVWACVGAP